MKRRKGNDFILLLIMTVILAATWVGFEVYRTLTRVPAPTGVDELLTPLNPKLNISILDKLEQRN